MAIFRRNSKPLPPAPAVVEHRPPPPGQARPVFRSRPALPFEKYRDRAGRVAVVDVETTGLGRDDRVLEVAVVTLNHQGQVIDEWETLVNPERDVGPVWIHGVTASMVARAPRFEQIADQLAARLHGAIVCSHNLTFDARMLIQEYDRCGADIDVSTGLCTLRVTGGTLAWECTSRGITPEGAHRALADARATSRLLLQVVDQLPAAVHPARVGGLGVPAAAPVPRTGQPANLPPPPFLAHVIQSMTHQATPAAIAEYVGLLDRAMADLHVDLEERQLLASLAADLGLSPASVDRANRSWLNELVSVATADGVVDDDEFDQLLRAAHVLGLPASYVADRTQSERADHTPFVLAPGIGVTFTGVIDEDSVARHARGLGLKHEPSITKSRTALLVADDPATDSGKARKAREYGIPIVSLDSFLATVSPGATVQAITVRGAGREVVECPTCGRPFTKIKTRGRKSANCEGCGGA